jgi:hypothetical protein
MATTLVTGQPIENPIDRVPVQTVTGSGSGGGAGLSGGFANPPSPPSAVFNPTAHPFDEAQLTADEEAQLRGVISQVASGLGASFTAGQFEAAINSKLQELGWTPGMILAAQQGENTSEPHGAGFVEQNKGGGFGAAAARDWGANIIGSVDKYLRGIFNVAPPVTLPQEPPQTPTPQVPVTDGSGLLTGAGAVGVPGSGSIASMLPGATSPTTTTSSGGANTIAILAIVAALALIGWYLWKKSKHGKTAKPGEPVSEPNKEHAPA